MADTVDQDVNHCLKGKHGLQAISLELVQQFVAAFIMPVDGIKIIVSLVRSHQAK